MNVFKVNSRSVKICRPAVLWYRKLLLRKAVLQRSLMHYMLKLPSISSKQIFLTESSFKESVVVPYAPTLF